MSAPLRALLPALLGVLLWSTPAAAQSLTSDIHEPDYALAWDMVFIAEGYEQGEEKKFLADARKLGRKLRQGATAAPMRDAYTFNLHYLFVAGEDRVSWRPGGKARKTPVRAYVDREGSLVTDDARADALAVEHAPDVDSIVIVAKLEPEDAIKKSELGDLREVVSGPEEVRANADMPYEGKRTRLPKSDDEAFIHELGHALFGLGDEYEELEGSIPADELGDVAETPNLSTDPSGARWADIVDTAFEGGGYYEKGVWRPEQHCRMRESRSRPFCAVCAAVIRGVPDARTPRKPRITRPADDARLVTGQPVRARWTVTRAPIYFTVEVYRLRKNGAAVHLWDTRVEGHLRTVELPLPEALGRYQLRVAGVNVQGDAGAEARVELERVLPAPGTAPGAAVEPGLADAVDEAADTH